MYEDSLFDCTTPSALLVPLLGGQYNNYAINCIMQAEYLVVPLAGV